MDRNQIVVIGGYGHVGQMICLQLASLFPNRVYAAGRNKTKAEQFASSTGGLVKPMVIDLLEEPNHSIFQKVKLVIVCVEQTNDYFPAFCLKHGVDYIDISASNDFLEKVEKLNDLAVTNKATAILSVGLAPGITNLLAGWLNRQLDSVEEVDIFLMLGLGDHHGGGAIEWTLQQTKNDFHKWSKGTLKTVRSFIDKKSVFFNEKLGWRRAYSFNFSDQHTLRKTLDVPEVNTYLCFDSRIVTKSIYLLKRTGLISIVPLQISKFLLTKVKIGKPLFILKVVGRAKRKGKDILLETLIHGEEEARATAAVASWVAQTLYNKEVSNGVYHIDEMFEWTEIYDSLKAIIEWEQK